VKRNQPDWNLNTGSPDQRTLTQMSAMLHLTTQVRDIWWPPDSSVSLCESWQLLRARCCRCVGGVTQLWSPCGDSDSGCKPHVLTPRLSTEGQLFPAPHLRGW